MSLTKTQIKIIEAAEIEFAEMGYAGASIREITNRAGVNIAAINYHFGSKEALYKEMILFHIEPINAVRIELLDEALRLGVLEHSLYDEVEGCGIAEVFAGGGF